MIFFSLLSVRNVNKSKKYVVGLLIKPFFAYLTCIYGILRQSRLELRVLLGPIKICYQFPAN